jgi:N-dimethylarginine dimethylaminohydrolase
MICTSLYSPEEIDHLGKYTEIIDVSEDDALGGITNSVRMGNSVMCASNITELKKTDELYQLEAAKIATLEKICSNEGMEPIIFNISEFMKSGALLSCCVMHLNYVDQTKSLI